MIRTEGSWTESLHPGAQARSGIVPRARAELIALFPELATLCTAAAPALAYPAVRRIEASVLHV